MKRFYSHITHIATGDGFGFGRHVESEEEYDQLLEAEIKSRGWDMSEVHIDCREQAA
ncbi:hypothetical protein [Salinicoccus roseus]|uniref:hypothetical protein n=1 Tax=Salinicoccus roseus TaxID=45670 RepID=UPI0023002EB0|nr:hypothetical protein [Salinicoccus roseus]